MKITSMNPKSGALKLNEFVFRNIVQEGQDPSETPKIRTCILSKFISFLFHVNV